MDPGSIPGRCGPGVAHSGLDSRRVRLAARGWHTAGLNACVLCLFLCQCLAVMLATFACFWTLPLITSSGFLSLQELCFPYVEAALLPAHWFQRFFVGWLIMLGRGDSLSLQELCFH